MNNSFPLYVHLDMNNQQVKSFAIENVTSFPIVTVMGKVIFHIGTGKFYGYNGTEWKILDNEISLQGGVVFRGGVSYTDFINSPTLGDQYVFTNTGITTNINPGTPVEEGDFCLYDGTNWLILNGNVQYATESIAGVIKVATNLETLAGLADNAAITPLKLNNWYNNNRPSADNGITQNGNVFELGGQLTQSTVINTNGKTLTVGITSFRDNTFKLSTGESVNTISDTIRLDGSATNDRLVTEKAIADIIVSNGNHTETVNLSANVPYVITHNLNSKNVSVTFYNSSDLYIIIPYSTTTVNTITVVSANTLTGIRLFIKK